MLPLLTFASGIVAGIVGVRLIKSSKAPQRLRAAGAATAAGLGTLGEKAWHGMGQAQAGLRHAAVSGLSTIEKSSASLRAKLESGEAEPEPEAAPEAEAPEAPEPVKPAVRKTSAHPAEAEEPGKPARGRRKAPEGEGDTEPGGEES